MSTNQDARPFVDLKKDAQEFRMKFDEDIEECLNYLDAKIKTLICDPDSFGNSAKSIHLNALAEFSKAKYDIFISTKSLINAKEREWLNYIGEMKKLFIENVEIFLAGTKLEVKLPPRESMPSHGPRKSPGNRKSNSVSVTSSIYPILSSFTKNISVLGSSLQGVVSKGNDEEEDDDDDVLEISLSQSSSISRRLSNSGLNTSRSSLGRRNSLEKDMNIALGQKSKCTDENEVLTTEIEVPLKGRRGRAAQKAKTNNMIVNGQNSSSTDENEVLTTDIPEKVPLKGRRGRAAAKTNDLTVAKNSSSIDENEAVTTEIEEPEKEVPLKGRRGRAAQKAKSTLNNITDENEAVATEIPEKEVPLKGRKGRTAQNKKTTVASKNSIDESKGPAVEMLENEVLLKGRRGKLAPKAKTNDFEVVAHSSTEESEDPIVEMTENEYPLKGRRGKSAPKAKPNDVTGKKVAVRGRKSVKPAVRGRKSVKPAVEEEIYEAGPSNVSFSEERSSSDELDIQTPLSRPVKSAARRKTLLPNLEVASGADIIPGYPGRSKAKRKTISGVSELESMVPSKRLKGKQNSSSQEEDSSADNLLESDGNYSEWMTLKSVDGKIPNQPAVYEVKVWRAKKPAYIGSCENLRHMLTLYNLRQNSGHKHLDKFIDRNYNEIQVRYEIISSFNNAKQEVKNRIDNFKAQHKNPPAYN